MSRGRHIALLLGLACAFGLLAPAAANATFPGANGKISFTTTTFPPAIYTINADGTGLQKIYTESHASLAPAWSADGSVGVFLDGFAGNGQALRLIDVQGNVVGSLPVGDVADQPSWSPDSTKLVYNQAHDCSNACYYDIATRNPDGTGVVRLTNTRASQWADWSPLGDKIAFVNRGVGLYTVSPDGQQLQQVPNTGQFDSAPSWSPDASRFAFARGGAPASIYSIKPDGSDLTRLTTDLPSGSPAWSPDGSMIAFIKGDASHVPTVYSLWVMRSDGSAQTRLTDWVDNSNGAPYSVTWQPIPVNYARPRGASPLSVSLVPAYQACTSANATHGAPLAFGSCSPPIQSSSQLTLGTPDANGRPAGTIGSVRYTAVAGNPSTPANEADAKIDVSITGVLRQSDLTPYGGELSADAGLRITDRSNTPYPGGPGPGTVEDTSFPVTVPCAAGSCSVSTTANAVVAGAVLEGRRTIWALGPVNVYDGGADGVASTTSDNTLFMDQGVFIP